MTDAIHDRGQRGRREGMDDAPDVIQVSDGDDPAAASVPVDPVGAADPVEVAAVEHGKEAGDRGDAEDAEPAQPAEGDGPAWASPADLLGWLEQRRAAGDQTDGEAEDVDPAAASDAEPVGAPAVTTQDATGGMAEDPAVGTADDAVEDTVEDAETEASDAVGEPGGEELPEAIHREGEPSASTAAPESDLTQPMPLDQLNQVPAAAPSGPIVQQVTEPEAPSVDERSPDRSTAQEPQQQEAEQPEPDRLEPGEPEADEPEAAEPEPEQPAPVRSDSSSAEPTDEPDQPTHQPADAWFDARTDAPIDPPDSAGAVASPPPSVPVTADVFAPSASPRPVPLPAVDPTALLEPSVTDTSAVPPDQASLQASHQASGVPAPPSGPPVGAVPPTLPPAARPAAPPQRRRGRWIAALTLAAGLLLGGVAAAATRDQVPRGTTIGGVEVGGLDRGEAVRVLAGRTPGSDAPIPVAVGGRQATLDPRAAGLTLDPERSVDAVLGGALDPGRVWHQLIGGGEEPALPEADRAKLRAALEPIAADTRQAPEDGAITIGPSGPSVVAAVTGTELDLDAATEAVAKGWLARGGTLDLPVRKTEPAITQAEVDRALQEIATPAATGPLTVVVGSTTVTVPEAALRPTLGVAPAKDKPGTLDLVVDGIGLRAAVLGAAPTLEQKPQDARIVLRDGVPTVVPSKDGVTLDPAKLAAAAKTALLTPERKVVLDSAVAKPKLTTDQAKALGVKEKVSTFSTNYPPNAARTNNLRIAARTVNGTLVLPGQTFSLNQVLGKRTPEKGYAEAPTIMNGRLVMGHGGGVSQMATTIYNNVFFAGLQDIYHMPHSFYISRYPEGREATVNFPNVDLKWKNDSPYAVLIEASVTSKVNVSFWSTKQYDDVIATKSERTNYRQPKTVYDPRPGCVAQEANPGFDVVVRRKVIKGGAVVKDQSWRTSYMAEDKVVCGPKPDAAPETTTTPAPPTD